jgi:hypothetical protein
VNCRFNRINRAVRSTVIWVESELSQLATVLHDCRTAFKVDDKYARNMATMEVSGTGAQLDCGR